LDLWRRHESTLLLVEDIEQAAERVANLEAVLHEAHQVLQLELCVYGSEEEDTYTAVLHEAHQVLQL
jgi:hypothetical protein